MEYWYIIQLDGSKLYSIGRIDNVLEGLNDFGNCKILIIQAVTSKDIETDLLVSLRTKFKSHDKNSFYGEYSDILQHFLSVTTKHTMSQEHLDETDDPTHSYIHEYYINQNYMRDRTLPTPIPSDIALSELSYNKLKKICKKHFPHMIPLILKKDDLEDLLTKCNDYVINFNGIRRDHIPSKSKGDIHILNLKNLCKNDRMKLRIILQLKKNISLEMVYYDKLVDYNNLKNLDIKRCNRESIVSYLSKFTPCDLKMNREHLLLLLEKTIENMDEYLKN